MIKKLFPFIVVSLSTTFVLDLAFLFMAMDITGYYFIGFAVVCLYQIVMGAFVLWDSNFTYSAESTTVMMSFGFLPFMQPVGLYFAYRHNIGK